MFSFSFKNRIAFNYLLSTALMVLFVFIIIYSIVSYSVYSHVDNDLAIEVNDHLSEIKIRNGSVQLIDEDEWKEQEHNTLNVNPVFIQILDSSKTYVEKSPNLKNLNLKFAASQKDFKAFDTQLLGKSIRQVQFPVRLKQRLAGYIIIAMSLEEANLVLANLRDVLWISYPIILVLLFFTARFIAGKNIRPIKSITETASAITRENLKARITMPQRKDELFVLSKTINDLLDRIENAVEREKQFTSDASHEMRTPLAVIKGTLEVLVRKPRDQSEYERQIGFCINEVDRLNNLVDELLLLARFDNQKEIIKKDEIYLNVLLLEVLSRQSQLISDKQLEIKTVLDKDYFVNSDEYLLAIVMSNLLSNAIKYSHENGIIAITLSEDDGLVACTFADRGIGIAKENIDKILNPFYRSQALHHPEIKGIGLGLSIVNKFCLLLNISLKIESHEKIGTTAVLVFLSKP